MTPTQLVEYIRFQQQARGDSLYPSLEALKNNPYFIIRSLAFLDKTCNEFYKRDMLVKSSNDVLDNKHTPLYTLTISPVIDSFYLKGIIPRKIYAMTFFLKDFMRSWYIPNNIEAVDIYKTWFVNKEKAYEVLFKAYDTKNPGIFIRINKELPNTPIINGVIGSVTLHDLKEDIRFRVYNTSDTKKSWLLNFKTYGTNWGYVSID